MVTASVLGKKKNQNRQKITKEESFFLLLFSFLFFYFLTTGKYQTANPFFKRQTNKRTVYDKTNDDKTKTTKKTQKGTLACVWISLVGEDSLHCFVLSYLAKATAKINAVLLTF